MDGNLFQAGSVSSSSLVAAQRGWLSLTQRLGKRSSLTFSPLSSEGRDVVCALFIKKALSLLWQFPPASFLASDQMDISL